MQRERLRLSAKRDNSGSNRHEFSCHREDNIPPFEKLFVFTVHATLYPWFVLGGFRWLNIPTDQEA